MTRASGTPYRDYLRNRIFEPLGMTETSFSESSVPAGQLATGYERAGQSWKAIDHQWQLGAVESAGGLYSSVTDLARFAAFELEAWPPRDGAESLVLSRSSLRESQLMAGPQRPGGGFGVNWGLHGDDPLGYRLAHSGAVAGYSSQILLLPDRHLALIALCSASDDDLNPILPHAAAILKAAAPIPPPRLSSPIAEVLPALVKSLNEGSPDLDRMFTKAFIDFVQPAKFAPMMQKLRNELGTCRIDHIIEGGVTHARAALTCAHTQATFDVSVDLRPPHLIGGFGWHY